MEASILGPLVERIGSFALIVWLMIWGVTRMNTKLEETQVTLTRVAESMKQANAIQERTLKLLDKMEEQLGLGSES